MQCQCFQAQKEEEWIVNPVSAKKLDNKALRVTHKHKILWFHFLNKVKNILFLRIALKPHNLSIKWPYA